MLLPSFSYGTYSDVKRKCSKIITKLKNGVLWEDATNCDMINTEEKPNSYIVFTGPSPSLGGQDHFNVYVLLSIIKDRMLFDKFPSEKESYIFNSCLQSEWGTLFLMTGLDLSTVDFFDLKSRHALFISRVVEYWDSYCQVGKRYSYGAVSDIKNIWDVPSTLMRVNSLLGISKNDLENFYKTGNLHKLYNYI